MYSGGGIDLFNHGYYWEAHEAWDPLWQAANRSTPHRLLFKGLILLAAAGVKIREGKQVAATRHAMTELEISPNCTRRCWRGGRLIGQADTIVAGEQ
jgi:hypothetical protein